MKKLALALVAAVSLAAIVAPASAQSFNGTLRGASVDGISATDTQSFTGISSENGGAGLVVNQQFASLNAGANGWTNNSGDVGGNTYAFNDVTNISGALTLGNAEAVGQGLTQLQSLQEFEASFDRLTINVGP